MRQLSSPVGASADSLPSPAHRSTLLSVHELKVQAQVLQDEARAAGKGLTRSQALEAVARKHGFRDWNAACLAAQLSRPSASAQQTPPRPGLAYRWLEAGKGYDFSEAATRKSFLRFIADVVGAGRHTVFEPEMLNGGLDDGLEWCVDANNDWWVFFDEGNPKRLRVQHRYADADALHSLCGWACYRWHMTRVSP